MAGNAFCGSEATRSSNEAGAAARIVSGSDRRSPTTYRQVDGTGCPAESRSDVRPPMASRSRDSSCKSVSDTGHSLRQRSTVVVGMFPATSLFVVTPAPFRIVSSFARRCDPGSFVAGGLVRARIVYSIRFGRSTPASSRASSLDCRCSTLPGGPVGATDCGRVPPGEGIGAGCIGRKAAGMTP